MLTPTLPRFRKNERFYHLYEQLNFFTGISLICAWGTFCNKLGGYKIIYCKDRADLEKQVDNIRKLRKYRGYHEYYQEDSQLYHARNQDAC